MGQDISGRNDAAAPLPVAAVAFPMAIPGLYDYKIPASLLGKILPGTPVHVELRSRRVWRVAIELRPGSEHADLKEIIAAKTEHWTDRSRSLIRLYQWMADYYQCDLGRVFRPLVGKGITSSAAKHVPVYSSIDNPTAELTKGQAAALLLIRSSGEALTKNEIAEKFGIAPSMVAALCKAECLKQSKRTVTRTAYEFGFEVDAARVTLTAEQSCAVETIYAGADEGRGRPFLLHGITGSGKTHVYTALAGRVLKKGMGVIILVPEISLTPQTIQRFRAAIGDCITVIHSHMSDGERRDSLQEIVAGGKRLVIGVRSAVLAPMDDVGLIIVDEEHDGSYKQSDTEPRYNARDVAIMRAHFQKALVVLGSATPSLESWQNAQSGKYHLIKLRERFGPACLPAVTIVDMNREHKDNNWTILSRLLESRMRAALDAKRQIILLLNRRGYSTTLICKECGYSHHCPNCSVTLRYHQYDVSLKCHLCGHEEKAPDLCPVCHGQQMKYKGTGIQKAEELIRAKFGDARILRMDHDTTRHRGAHHDILAVFEKKEADILIGTQMVAKGLNFPGVALVGVLQADTGLLFPDFRAAERTFQLLTQVAGRAGRSDSIGEVVIQTYYPEDPSILSASTHDYEGFCATELPNRRELQYPPFGKIARVLMSGPDDRQVESEMEKIAREIKNISPGVIVLGPSPAVLEKISNEFRYTLLLKSASSKNLGQVLSRIRAREKQLPKKMRMVIDVDPVNML
jgi:primosomal protein N' (replication factor Y)